MQLDPDLAQIRPYYDSLGDGMVQLSFTLPLGDVAVAEKVAFEMLGRMNLTDIALVEKKRIDPRFTFFVAYARTTFSVDAHSLLESSRKQERWDHHRVVLEVERIGRKIVVVGATLESDAHTVGLDAIFNVKGFAGHRGLEDYPCFRTFNLGAQVPFRVLLDQLRRERADAVLISQTVTQKGLHLKNLTRFADLLEAEGLRAELILVLGGPSMTPELAKELGYDAGFGRGTVPEAVASYLVQEFLRRHHG